MRWRITVRGSTVELRGWIETTESDALAPGSPIVELGAAVGPLGLMVYASPAEPDWDPFQ